jgi:hypothetical protein
LKIKRLNLLEWSFSEISLIFTNIYRTFSGRGAQNLHIKETGYANKCVKNWVSCNLEVDKAKAFLKVKALFLKRHVYSNWSKLQSLNYILFFKIHPTVSFYFADFSYDFAFGFWGDKTRSKSYYF